jgi:hypothetical protein
MNVSDILDISIVSDQRLTVVQWMVLCLLSHVNDAERTYFGGLYRCHSVAGTETSFFLMGLPA